MDVHPEKARSLNQGAARISSLLKHIPEVVDSLRRPTGTSSTDHLSPIVLQNPIEGPFTIKTYTSSGQRQVVAIRRKESSAQEWIGYDEELYKEFKKFITSLNKEAFINQYLTAGTVESISFDWAIDTYNKRNTPEFTDFIQDYIADNTSTHKIYFPISNLLIGGIFKIGKVVFEFFTEGYFDNMWNELVKDNPHYSSNAERFDAMRKQYQGKVCATYTVKAEASKAIDIAFKNCSLAIDALKICSRTAVIPEEVLAFDIESRLTKNLTSSVIITQPHDATVFKINSSADLFPYEITKVEWSYIQALGLNIFSEFLMKYEPGKHELSNLIASSMERCGNAFSERDMHQRVVELYTILESLLLPNESSPILEAVTKYLPMLVAKQKDHRIECSKLVRSMYKVRSSLIHHGKKISFEIIDLHYLQNYVITLLKNLIILSSKHDTKQAILSEIDDAMLSSY